MSKRKVLRFTITCSGETDNDIESALNEAVSRITEGFSSGTDRNDTGAFYFTVTDVPEEEAPA